LDSTTVVTAVIDTLTMGDKVIEATMVSIIGMVIVYAVLVVISFVIALTPKFLAILNKYIPEPQGKHGASKKKAAPADDSAVAVAIAAAIHKNNSAK